MGGTGTGLLVLALVIAVAGLAVLVLQARRRTKAAETAAREATEALARAETEVALTKAVRLGFLDGLNHELRTPLTAINGYLVFLGNPGMLSSFRTLRASAEAAEVDAAEAEVKSFADKAKSATDKLMQAHGQLMELAQLERSAVDLSLGPVEIAPAMAAAAASQRAAAEGKGLTLEAEPIPGTVEADHDRLVQILSILTENAVKFTETGHVRLRAVPQGDQMSISVEDTGPGLTETELKTVLTGYGGTDASDARTNSGLGVDLAIARRLTELLQGHLSAKSTPGEGSVFTLTLQQTPSD